MNDIVWKNKLVILWILQILNFLAVLVIPESLAAIVEEVGEAIGPLIAFYFFLTCLMMVLAIFTRPTLSRWPMILVGVFYSLVKIQWITNSLTGDMVLELFLTELWGFVAAAMIIWYGWKIPKPVSVAQQAV
jgi:hypothetical protein